MSIRNVVAALACAAIASTAQAQLRIVSINASNSSSGSAGPRAGMQTILSAIGSSVSDDPTTPGNTGIAKPLDVLCLQEFNAPATTGAQYAALLNSTYGTTSFSFGTLAGASTGSGTQGIIYNSATVQLVSQATVGTASTSGQPRQTLRYQLRPVGYDSSADVWIYNSHFKAGSDSTSANRRNIETTAIRNDVAANLPANANTIYLGDFNVYSGSEAMFQTLTAPGAGQAFDPINKPSWSATEQYKNIHTQSPFDPASGNSGFTGGGMDSRFDWQMISGNLNDRHGLAYIPNSYQAFGNNGSHQLNQPIDSGTGASSAVLQAESSILDHLPIVADYQLPAKMSVSVASVPQQVITGANVGVNLTVTNAAPVQFANGADKLDYVVTGSGALNGGGNFAGLAALSPGNSHALQLDTSAVGTANGTVSVSSSSESVANGSFTQQISTQVLDHAHPELSVATIDFGIRGRTLGGASIGFQISNLTGPGPTAGLDLDSISANGDTAALTTNAATFTNLAAGSNRNFTANIHDTSNGSFAASYTFNFSDQDLPGATNLSSKTLVLTGIIATPGDTDLSGLINFDDYVRTDNGFNNHLSGWANGDFDGNGVVNFDDYVLIDLFFNMQNGGGNAALRRAQRWLAGDSSPKGIDPAVLSVLEHHLDEFGQDYARSFVAAVPEPTTLTWCLGAMSALRRRRRPRGAQTSSRGC